MNRDAAVVVGAGHNGLVAAFYLARAGLDVTVIEARDVVGGACVTEEVIPGYRFSTCANRAAWLRPQVVQDLGIVERGVTFSAPDGSPLGPRGTHLASGEPFVWWPDPERTRDEIARFSVREADAWMDWRAFWGQFVELFGPYLLTLPPTLRELVERADGLGVGDALQSVLTTSVADLADRFFQSALLRNHVQPPHDASTVHDTGSSLVMAVAAAAAGYTETGRSAPGGFVRGGMGALTDAMAEAAREQGVRIVLGSPVERIVTVGGQVEGVRTATGEFYPCRLVMSNADPKRTFRTLVDPEQLDARFLARVDGLTTRIAPLKLLCALDELPQFDGLPSEEILRFGSYVICPDREYQVRAWRDAYDGRVPTAPIISVSVPSAWDETVAPAGHHTASVFIRYGPVRLRDGTWPDRKAELADHLIDLIGRRSPNFKDAVVDYVLLTPEDFEARHLLTDGSIHHVDLSANQLLWNRPLPELARYRTPVHGLYLCGAGTHPYGEVSGASGHNAAHAVLADLRTNSR